MSYNNIKNTNFLKHFTLITFVVVVCFLSNFVVAKDLVCQIIKSNNYPCEVHRVITVDGYNLTLHRIPAIATTTTTKLKQQQTRKPFILFHGLIGSAADFVLPGKQRALACLLHEHGYDVWLPNARGTTHSKRHSHMDSNDVQFWNFTWHEIGYYDLPAIVDYVLENTQQQQVHYVAHSQGTTVFFVLLSERPVYNRYFASATLLAPVAYLGNLQSPPLRLMAQKYNEIEALLNHLGLHELFPSTALNQLGGHLLCGKGVPTQNFCLLATFFSVGYSDYQMDRQLFPRIFETTPAGISRRQLQHFGQIVKTGKFQKFDFVSKKRNFEEYKRKTPPEYKLENVRVPLKMFYGNRDLLVTKQDVQRLAGSLKNAPHTLHEVNGFNHIDLLYATQAANFIYKQILNEAKRFH